MLKDQENKQLTIDTIELDNLIEALGCPTSKIDYINDFDFSEIVEEITNRYCLDNGRPAYPVEVMLKTIILQYFENFTDREVVWHLQSNLVYKRFVGLGLYDNVPTYSTIAKFRIERLNEDILNNLLTCLNIQLIKKKEIKGKIISIDATHSASKAKKLTPGEYLNQLLKQLNEILKFNTAEEISIDIPKIPRGTSIKEEVKTVISKVKETLEMLESLENEDEEKIIPGLKISEEMEDYQSLKKELQEKIEDERFLKGLEEHSLSDPDARVGHKSKNKVFYGYKDELIADIESRYILATNTYPGNYCDGVEFKELLDKVLKLGIKPEKLLGDKAYFKGEILKTADEKEIQPYIPINLGSYKEKEGFEYCKDADQFTCKHGNETVSVCKIKEKDTEITRRVIYTFNSEICKMCPDHKKCVTEKKYVAKRIECTINYGIYNKCAAVMQKEGAKEIANKRALHESINHELKNVFEGKTQQSYGLISARKNGLLRALMVNFNRYALNKMKQE